MQRTPGFLEFYSYSGPGRIRTCDQTVMHPTTAFAAPFGFVVWTIPSPSKGACRLVSTPSRRFIETLWLGSGLPYLAT
jgi:hypothetical protein